MNSKKQYINAILDLGLGISVLTINNLGNSVGSVIPTPTTPIPYIPTTTSLPINTTTFDPFPPQSLSNELENSINTYVANTFYGISLLVTGIGELCKNKFAKFKNISTVINGVCLSASGLNMLLASKLTTNDAIIPLVAGIKQVKDIVLKEKIKLEPLEARLPFDEERANLVNAIDPRVFGSMDSLSVMSENIIYQQPQLRL